MQQNGQECSFEGSNNCMGKLAMLQASFDNHDKNVLRIADKVDKVFRSIDELKEKNGTVDVAIARLEDNGTYCHSRIKTIEAELRAVHLVVNSNDKRISKIFALCSALVTVGSLAAVIVPQILK